MERKSVNVTFDCRGIMIILKEEMFFVVVLFFFESMFKMINCRIFIMHGIFFITKMWNNPFSKKKSLIKKIIFLV